MYVPIQVRIFGIPLPSMDDLLIPKEDLTEKPREFVYQCPSFRFKTTTYQPAFILMELVNDVAEIKAIGHQEDAMTPVSSD